MIARNAAAAALAAIVTSSLLFSMQKLIVGGMPPITAPATTQRIDIVRVEQVEAVEKPRARPERPPLPAARPTAVAPEPFTSAQLEFAAAITAPRFIPGAVISRGSAAVGDSDYVPLLRALRYPVQAVARNLEGYVILEYTVTATGTVRDISVVESSAALFESSAIKAALEFEYKPRVVSGEPVEVTGVTNKIVFTLEPGQRLAMQL